LLKRVAVPDVDPELAERHWARFRAILVTHRPSDEADPEAGRSREGAELRIEEIALQLEEGADFGELAAQLSDDPGARERHGDLGWVYRFAPGLDPVFDRGFLLRAGERSAPLARPGALVLLQRME
jgi:hypothetical protein